jgi:hypothetical protein
VFINGHLAVDIGGVHSAETGSVTLDASTEGSFGLTEGGLYEAAVFQAERHTVASNYRLSLSGFFPGTTQCESVCGDGIVTRDEICDNGMNIGAPGGCMPGCEEWAPGYEPNGFFRRTYDGSVCGGDEMVPDWGTFDWNVETPPGTSIRFEFRTADEEAGLDSATPVTLTVPPSTPTVDVGSLLEAGGERDHRPYLRVTAVLATDVGATPVLRSYDLQFDCLSRPRDNDASGVSCSGSPAVCTVGCSATSETASTCYDGLDNDCDGDVDCADADCSGVSCGGGRVCNGGACVCSGSGSESSDALCSDGIDNDCDGDVDCADAECGGLSCGDHGLVCSAGACMCAAGGSESSPSLCTDGIDNDCDGDIDCADGNCSGVSCGAHGLACDAGACRCGAGGAEDTPTLCTDGIDNDCDGDIDGGDADCGGVGGRLETVVTTADGAWSTVMLASSYARPVIVCSVEYSNNTEPVVARLDNVSADRFDVRLQRPGAGSVVADRVHCLVVEEGAWTIDGVKIEAYRYNSTRTDSKGDWDAEARGYTHSYSDPVVLGQVMSSNDSEWSVFWCRGNDEDDAPSSSHLYTGKMVAEDPDETRADEIVGYVVIEEGRGTLGSVAYEARLGPDDIRGLQNGGPHSYSFTSSFASAPAIAVATNAGMDGGDGGWAQTHGTSPSTLLLSIDEDTLGDSERGHTTERVGYFVAESPIVL